jgi:hypothetical protein
VPGKLNLISFGLFIICLSTRLHPGFNYWSLSSPVSDRLLAIRIDLRSGCEDVYSGQEYKHDRDRVPPWEAFNVGVPGVDEIAVLIMAFKLARGLALVVFGLISLWFTHSTRHLFKIRKKS